VRWGRADGRRNKSCSAASRPLDRRHIALRDIAYAERLRGVNEGNVKRLVGSMREPVSTSDKAIADAETVMNITDEIPTPW
jgi:hypothetical protein